MDLLILADIDDVRWQGGAGSADVVLACGDVHDEVILEAARAFGCSTIFAVKGNHDTDAPFADPIVDAHLSIHTVAGTAVGGFNGCWRYKPRGHFLYDDAEVTTCLQHMPRADIFIAHNSPRGIHDVDDHVHIGFTAFSTYIEKHRPRLFIHGHQHTCEETVVGGTRVIGLRGHRLLEYEPKWDRRPERT